MGTHHEIKVIVDGVAKVIQYGQWDGYPNGQGADIAEFIQKRLVGKPLNIAKFKNRLRDCRFLISDERDAITVNKNWPRTHPWLSRDAGADILWYIYNKRTKEILDTNTEENKLYCQYFYVINMDDQTVQMNGRKKYPFEEWTVEKMRRLR